MDHNGFLIRQNFDTFQNLDADSSDHADTILTGYIYGPILRVERIDTHGNPLHPQNLYLCS